ncbi:SCP domain-containing protein [Caenorhabditis elegans]|uniref:SCP domain-containing protein n=1 Tax=Caenorhabditis elegans TaxID=6239 RepID=Q9NEJ5_CAEEL|nr:SCP domain-containing protein [Caenorhabditis elegans]CAB81982.2 SCP domain-containing protein [Caenorhabditis elegans]|eukprot:NP_507851.2 Uncharacterized protein CELE_Y116F11B.13 [Caenorhabditis elegans]
MIQNKIHCILLGFWIFSIIFEPSNARKLSKQEFLDKWNQRRRLVAEKFRIPDMWKLEYNKTLEDKAKNTGGYDSEQGNQFISDYNVSFFEEYDDARFKKQFLMNHDTDSKKLYSVPMDPFRRTIGCYERKNEYWAVGRKNEAVYPYHVLCFISPEHGTVNDTKGDQDVMEVVMKMACVSQDS